MSAHGRPGVPHALLAPLERQVELLRGLVERALGPFDAVFDLLEQSGTAMHRQADALSESARALEQAAELMRAQAELYERTVRTARAPSDIAKGLAGIRPRDR
jgi:hypothetical protein